MVEQRGEDVGGTHELGDDLEAVVEDDDKNNLDVFIFF